MKNNKLVFLVAVSALLVGGLGGYLFAQHESQQIASSNIGMKSAPYRNNPAGFTLDALPEYYIVQHSDSDYNVVYFNRTTTMPEWLGAGGNTGNVFTIAAMPLEEFYDLEHECKTKPPEETGPVCFPFMDNLEGHRVLGKNNQFAFIYSRADRITDYPSDFTPDYFEDAERVVESFKTYDF